MANKFYDLYVTMFGKGDSEDVVHQKISAIQSVAQRYSTEYYPDPLPMTDPTLDTAINNQYKTGISLSSIERQAVVDMLVNDHNLQNLKPWGITDPNQLHTLVW